jgi:type IV pilus assembly protein PilB
MAIGFKSKAAETRPDDAPASPVSAGLGSGLGAALVARGVSPDVLASALAQSGGDERKMVSQLVRQGAITSAALVEVFGEQTGLQIVDLRQTVPDQEALELLLEDDARALQAIPLDIDGATVCIAIADPTVRSRVDAICSRPATYVLARDDEIRTLIDRAYRADAAIERLTSAFQTTAVQQTAVQAVADAGPADDDAPVVQVVNRVVAQALRDRASDVHIEPLDDSVRVRYRVDGTLIDAFTLPSSMHTALVSRIKILSSMNIVERRKPQDGQFSMRIDGREIDARVSTVSTVFGEKVVMRLLDKSNSMRGLAQLGMPPETYKLYSDLVHAPFGMVICAGPTGAGKTTTLYATLLEINEGGKNVSTIEDPVEYVFPGINQIQTNEQAGLTFATGLRALLRQDPDVILVGEIRDVDTARIAVQAALTGHFVASSLHGTDAVAALHRLLDMGVESFLVASAIVAVVSQRLLRRVCDACKAPYQPTAQELDFYQRLGGAPKERFLKGEGCANCSGTGYRGRIGVYEVLKITPELRRLIVGWATQDELRRMAQAQGMRTLTDEALQLIEADITTISDVVKTLYAA